MNFGHNVLGPLRDFRTLDADFGMLSKTEDKRDVCIRIKARKSGLLKISGYKISGPDPYLDVGGFENGEKYGYIIKVPPHIPSILVSQ